MRLKRDFSKYDLFFQVGPTFPSVTHFLFGNFAEARLTKSLVSLRLRTQAYSVACFRRKISLASISWNSVFHRHSGSLFVKKILQENYSEQSGNNICIFLPLRSKPWWPRWIHDPPICIIQIKASAMSALKTGKKSHLMNSHGLWNYSRDTATRIWLGSSDGPRIWTIKATNRTWICRHALIRPIRSLIEFRAIHMQRSLWL